MDVTIHSPLKEGSLNIIASKSMTHRAIICAALAIGKSYIYNPLVSEDTKATIDILRKLGTVINEFPNYIEVIGKPIMKPTENLYANESGSTLRFLIPIALLQSEKVCFDGAPGLRKRPQNEYFSIFDQMNIQYSKNSEVLPLELEGKLVPGTYHLKGNISSQFVTGLLLALPLLNGASNIVLDTPLESKEYVDMTLSIQKQFGIEIIEHDNGYSIAGNQKYSPISYHVTGDFSQAAFYIIAGILGANLELFNLEKNTHQADEKVLEFIKSMNGTILTGNGSIKPTKSETIGTIIDISQSPDIGPIMALICALSEGKSQIINGSRLRIKESDRIKAITTELNRMGAKITETNDGMIIEGVSKLHGNMKVYSWNDHRIVMTLAIAAIAADGPITIVGAEAVNKSYPTFFEDYVKLKGVITYE